MKRHGKHLITLLLITLAVFIASTGVIAVEATAAAAESAVPAAPAKAADQGISVEIHHVLVEGRESGSVQVKEVLKINNSLNETFTGTESIANNKKAVLKISLPTGYSNLQVEGLSQDSVIANPDGVITTSPLSPGTTQISLFYDISFGPGNSLDFEKKVNYPTDIVYVLSPQGQLKIKNDGNIQDYGIQEFEGRSYHVLLLNKALPEQKFGLSISPDRVGQGFGAPKAGFHSVSHLERWANSPLGGTDPHLWVAALAVLLFAGVAGGGLYLKKKQREQKAKENDERMSKMLDNLVIRQKRLLNKIDALDEKIEKGETDSGDFGKLRKQYINKLIKIKAKMRELEALEEAGNC